MTREQAIDALNEHAKSGDWEVAHSRADQVLCELLIALGYEDVVRAWDEVGKWYA